MNATSDQLIRDVRTVVQDAEELIKATAGEITESTREARAKLAGALVVAKETCNKLENQGRAVDEFIHENPYPAIGAAFVLGLVIGVIAVRA